jgi:hypothetical protein
MCVREDTHTTSAHTQKQVTLLKNVLYGVAWCMDKPPRLRAAGNTYIDAQGFRSYDS